MFGVIADTKYRNLVVMRDISARDPVPSLGNDRWLSTQELPVLFIDKSTRLSYKV